MPFFARRIAPVRPPVHRHGVFWSAAVVGVALSCSAAGAAPSILVDAASGEVLEQQEATRSWFPASTTKLMTVYVALDAVSAGRISLNTPIVVSPRAARMAPSKMGFRPGTQVTLDNALKMLMVKSANDIAVTIAEGVSGSVEGFADEMNAAAAKLGMRESRFYNPNGLPDSRHVSSARDLAVLARALLVRFPDRSDLYEIGAMRLGNQIIPTHNGLLGRYPGADGMKTGFTCSAGFNIVATASRGGRRLIAVVLGAPGAKVRDMKAVSMFNHGFSGQVSNYGSLSSMPSVGVTAAVDARNGVCANRSQAQRDYLASIEGGGEPVALRGDQSQSLINQPERALFAFGGFSAPPQNLAPGAVVAQPRPAFAPVDVFVGPIPGWTGQVAHADDYSGPSSTATAYADDKKLATPLEPAADALPMRRGKARAVAKAAKPQAAKVALAKPEAAETTKKTKTAPPAAKGKEHGKVAKAVAEKPEHVKPAAKTTGAKPAKAPAKPAAKVATKTAKKPQAAE